MPTWWIVLPPTVIGRMRPVTSALAVISARGVITRTTSVLAIPFSPASSGLISTKSSGCSSASHGSQRLITPERWCSVRR